MRGPPILASELYSSVNKYALKDLSSEYYNKSVKSNEFELSVCVFFSFIGTGCRVQVY